MENKKDVQDVIPMTLLESEHHISSSMVEFYGLEALERAELDEDDDPTIPMPQPPPFAPEDDLNMRSFEAAVRTNPFFDG